MCVQLFSTSNFIALIKLWTKHYIRCGCTELTGQEGTASPVQTRCRCPELAVQKQQPWCPSESSKHYVTEVYLWICMPLGAHQLHSFADTDVYQVQLPAGVTPSYEKKFSLNAKTLIYCHTLFFISWMALANCSPLVRASEKSFKINSQVDLTYSL